MLGLNIWNMKLGQHGVAKLLAQQSSQPRKASGQLQALSHKLPGQRKALQCHCQLSLPSALKSLRLLLLICRAT